VIVAAWRALAKLIEPEPTWKAADRMAGYTTTSETSDGEWWTREYRERDVDGMRVGRWVVGPRQHDFEALADALIPHRVRFSSVDKRLPVGEECDWLACAVHDDPTGTRIHLVTEARHPILSDAAAVAAARVLGLIPGEPTP